MYKKKSHCNLTQSSNFDHFNLEFTEPECLLKDGPWDNLKLCVQCKLFVKYLRM